MRRTAATLLVTTVLAAALAAGLSSAATRQNPFAINEIGVGSRGYVSLTNTADVPATLAGLQLCQGKRCSALPRVRVRAGRTVRVATYSGSGLQNVVARNAAFGPMRPSDGEIALAVSGGDVTAKSLRGYVQWGKARHALTPLAVKAGLWIKGSYAPTSRKATRLYRLKGGLWIFE